MVTVERITAIENVELGEGPHWDSFTESLYFVDIFGKSIHKYCPKTNKHTKASVGKHVSIIIPVKGERNKFIISLNRELRVVEWDGESEKVESFQKIAEVDNAEDTIDNRFNDGKCDPSGRLWAGTMGGEPQNGHVKQNQGSLYSLEAGKTVKHLTSVSISNGLAWNSTLKKFYYIDSPKRTIDEFDYNPEKGTISNRHSIFSFDNQKIDGFPDGMAIDTDGNLWVAVFNGYKIINIDPRQQDKLLAQVKVPAKQVTSVAFGGPNLDVLYVTSAGFTVDGVELPPPDHGAVFKVTGTGAKGFSGVPVKL